jgi:hypothetical protein
MNINNIIGTVPVFFLFKVKELPDDEQFSFDYQVSYFSRFIYCLKTNSKYRKLYEIFDNRHNTVG